MKHISEKAYKGFNQRLIDAFRSIDPYHIDGIGVVMGDDRSLSWREGCHVSCPLDCSEVGIYDDIA